MNFKDIIVKNPRKKETIYSYLKSKGYSENFLKNIRKEFGFIKLNNNACFINVLVQENDVISVNNNPNTKTTINSCIIPLDIIYEDDDVIAVNKPALLPTMPSKSHYDHNLSGALVSYMENKSENFVVRVINRLDKEACGIVLVAKNSIASNFLNEKNPPQKTYYAFCDGIIENNLIIDKNIETLMNKDGYNYNKRTTSSTYGKSATTFVYPIKQYKNKTLIKITLQHGRTHQIRVHMSSIGHPLCGDTLYGTKSEEISHTALLCKEMQFVQPSTNEIINLSIDFPVDFKQLME